MNNQAKGTIALLVLTSLYGMYGVFNRFIEAGFGPFSQQLFSNLFALFFVAILFVAVRPKFNKIKKMDLKWIALWLLASSFNLIILFIAFNNLPLSTVYFLFYSTMIISGVLCGTIFFKEKLNRVKWISIIFSLLGIVSIFSLSVTEQQLPYVLLTLTSGVILGLYNTISKKFSDNYHEIQIIYWGSLAGVAVAFIGLLLFGEAWPTFALTPAWGWLCIYAFVQVITVWLLVYGFKNLEAQVGSVILPVEIIFATIFGYLIFGETLTMGTLIGGLLIASAAFLPNITMLVEQRRMTNR